MFGIGMPEMLLILAVALIIFGPKRLPELAKSLGRALGEFKRATSDLKDSIEKDTGLDEVRGSLNDVKKDIKSQVDLVGSAPSPGPKTASDQSDAHEPLNRVKDAFDQMNAGADPSADNSIESEPESEKDPSIDRDTQPQEKPNP